MTKASHLTAGLSKCRSGVTKQSSAAHDGGESGDASKLESVAT